MLIFQQKQNGRTAMIFSIIFSVIPFIIISSVVISIFIKVFKSSIGRVKDTINEPIDAQENVNKDTITGSLEQLNGQKSYFVICEYCGASQSKNKERCSSCGAHLPK